MVPNLIESIEAFFVTHNGDGEFHRPTPCAPYTVILPSIVKGQIVFCTKPTTVSQILIQDDSPTPLGIIGRGGLPHGGDIPWLRRIAGAQRLVFLGDMDPVDLMIFAWLRLRLTRRRIVYLGLGDGILKSVKVSLSRAVTIPLSEVERKAMTSLATVMPELEDTIGPHCLRLLRCGYKVEVEALLGGDRKTSRGLKNAIMRIAGKH